MWCWRRSVCSAPRATAAAASTDYAEPGTLASLPDDLLTLCSGHLSREAAWRLAVTSKQLQLALDHGLMVAE